MSNQNRIIVREGFGEILFSRRFVNRGLSYILQDEGQMATFAAVPDVLRYGKEINEQNEHKNRPTDSVTFAAPVMLGNKRVNLAVVVQYNEERNKYKTHKVFLPDGRVFIFDNEEAEVAPNTPENPPYNTRSASDKRITQEQNNSKSQKSMPIFFICQSPLI